MLEVIRIGKEEKKKYSMSEQAVSTSLDSIYTWHVSKPTRRAVPLSMVHGP